MGATKIIYVQMGKNTAKKKKSLSRDKPRSVFIGGGGIRFRNRAFHFRASFAGATSHYGGARRVMATPKYFAARAERMPNAYSNHKCGDTHCRSAIGHATACNRRF